MKLFAGENKRIDYVLYIVLVSVFIIGIPSCKKNNDCVGKEEQEVTINGVINSGLFVIAKKGENCESFAGSGIPCYRKYDGKEKITSDRLVITFTGSYFNSNYAGFNFFDSGILGTSAFACSPMVEKFSNQKITDIKVTSNGVFNQSYPLGQDLFPILVDPITGRKLEKEKVELLNKTEVTFSQGVSFDSKHVFTFRFVLDGTDTLSFSTPVVSLLKG